uniref:Uncharacterized protein n=1 Tax=Arundo donax TaxID=35708 RepID=A0A0A9FV02_ARUDO
MLCFNMLNTLCRKMIMANTYTEGLRPYPNLTFRYSQHRTFESMIH